MKKNYRVKLNEIHISSWDVEANSEQDAVDRVLDGDGELIHTEYSHTPDARLSSSRLAYAVHCATLEL